LAARFARQPRSGVEFFGDEDDFDDAMTGNGVIDLQDEGTSVWEDVDTGLFTGFPPRA